MITDDDLLLYHYRDGQDAAERARISAALAEQPELAQRLHRLVGRLDAAAAIPEVPVPAETLTRWRAALDVAATTPTLRAPSEIRRPSTNFRWLAAAAVVLVAIFSVSQFMRQPSEQIAEVTTPTGADAPGSNGAYERGLKSHLAATEQQLVSLESATPEQRARLVETIIEQNRVYALAAERAGEPQLARVLRAFTPVLETLSQEKGDPTASVAQLSFEMRVMQGRLDAGTGASSSKQSATL